MATNQNNLQPDKIQLDPEPSCSSWHLENQDEIPLKDISVKKEPPDDNPDSGAEKNYMLNDLVNADTSKPNDVDKFKRRLIRALARKMLVEKEPEETMWETLRKDTGCDCKLLWMRMRALTLKKLKRLLTAEDYLEGVTKIARLSVTDWLLFDLVLVHEKIDVIGRDLTEDSEDPKVLYELFELVQKYDIENLSGETLVESWTQLTLEYNKRGRQCSPMLLQRRWYQLKQMTKDKFYAFWFAYRGAAAKLEKAKDQKPSHLLQAIAKKYPYIVTKRFPQWDELVSTKKVIMREDFENLNASNANNQGNSDVQIIEPAVETIDLDGDSDTENSTILEKPKLSNITETKLTTPTAKISGRNSISNVEELSSRSDIIKDKCKKTNEHQSSEYLTNLEIGMLESTHIPLQGDDHMSYINSSDIDNPNSPNTLKSKDMIIKANNSDIVDELVLPKITSVTGGVEVIDYDDYGNAHHVYSLTQTAENNKLNNIANNLNVSTITTNSENINNTTDILPSKTINNSIDVKALDQNKDYEVELNDLIIIDDGIEIEDDGIEFYEEEDKEGNKAYDLSQNIKKKENERNQVPKFDYKLLLTPVVYTKKVDDMDVFKFIDFQNVRDKRVIECSYVESKPVIKTVKVDNLVGDIAKQLESDDVSDYKMNECVESGKCNVKKQDKDDVMPIKCSSWLFQKPKNRSYNPIQLCKNPDFNTRLNRLTAGFLSCERNRYMLKECKPLTIDLHKSFEMKLIDGVLYVRDGKFTTNPQNTETKIMVPLDNTSKVVMPEKISAMVDEKPTIKDEKILTCEKNNDNSFIDLHQNNKKLLTVEITPMKDDNVNCKPPVEIVTNLSHDCNITSKNQTMQETVDNKNNTQCNNSQFQHSAKGTLINPEPEKVNPYSHRKLPKNRFHNKLCKTMLNVPKNFRFGYPSSKPSVAWNSQHKNNVSFDDEVLLAPDTLDKMLLVLSNKEISTLPKQQKRKIRYDCKKKQLKLNVILKTQLEKQTTPPPVINSSINENLQKIHESTKGKEKPVIKRPRKRKPPLESSKYCCWALEKYVTKRLPNERHYCPKPICICCCRDLLLQQSLTLKQGKKELIYGKINIDSDIGNNTTIEIDKVSKEACHENINFINERRSAEKDSESMTELKGSESNASIATNDTERSEDILEAVVLLSDDEIQENINSHSHPDDGVSSILVNVDTLTENLDQDLNVLTSSSLTNNKEESLKLVTCKTRIKSQPTIAVKSIDSLKDDGMSKNVKPITSNNIEIKTNNDCILIENDIGIKSINDKISKPPIYLGKNKILLCSDTNVSKSKDDLQALVPPGVNVVVLPDGEIALSINPGANLPIDRLDNLYNILSSVQTQLGNTQEASNILANLNPSNNIVDRDVPNEESEKAIECSEKNNLHSQANENIDRTIQTDKVTPISLLNSNNEDNIKPTCNNLEHMIIENDSLKGPIEVNKEFTMKDTNNLHTTAKIIENDTLSNDHNTKKSILSDLMEMSGISENDTICDEKVQTDAEIKDLQSSSNKVFVMKQVDIPSNIKNVTNDQAIDKPVIRNALLNRKDLSIVSSFPELKRCHDKNCQFYKMDTQTGEILPINLKIKKKKQIPPTLCKVVSKTVIDLTDEQDLDPVETVPDSEPHKEITKIKTYKKNKIEVKPIKLLKSVHPSDLNESKNISLELLESDTDTPHMPRQSNVSGDLKRQKERHKPLLLRRKEVIKKSNKSYENIPNETNINDESDSDDEPLAKKALRKKENCSTDNSLLVTTVPSNSIHDEVMHDVNEYFEPEPVLFQSNVEESEEDCILGV